MKHYLEDHEYNFLKKVSFILTKSYNHSCSIYPRLLNRKEDQEEQE